MLEGSGVRQKRSARGKESIEEEERVQVRVSRRVEWKVARIYL